MRAFFGHKTIKIALVCLGSVFLIGLIVSEAPAGDPIITDPTTSGVDLPSTTTFAWTSVPTATSYEICEWESGQCYRTDQLTYDFPIPENLDKQHRVFSVIAYAPGAVYGDSVAYECIDTNGAADPKC